MITMHCNRTLIKEREKKCAASSGTHVAATTSPHTRFGYSFLVKAFSMSIYEPYLYRQ